MHQVQPRAEDRPAAEAVRGLRVLRLLLFACLIALLGCGGEGASATAGTSSAPPKADAAAGAEAMCAEHGVLKAICTKCNPKLIPVFQAKGDWCAEHGLPESVCPICHPERGGKPDVSVAPSGGEKGEAPADGTKVKLKSKEIAEHTGIEVVDAAVAPSVPSVEVTAKIVHDARKVAHVNARTAGVVRELKVDVGQTVKRGDVLAVIDSREVGAERSRAAGAAARVKAAQESLDRQKALFTDGITGRKSVAEAERELAEAKAEHAALQASLSVVGKRAGGAGGYALEAPLDGVVTARAPTVGELVEANALVVEVVDTSSVWAELDVPEAELVRVSAGQRVALALDALPGRELSGTIDFIAPAVDPRTRTARARVSLPNPDGRLRANMFGRARVLGGAGKPAVVVPRAAVQRVHGVSFVFVKLADDLFEARRVTLGAGGTEQRIEVKEGVQPGEPVVTTGSFLLKTETLKDSIGAGCCEGD